MKKSCFITFIFLFLFSLSGNGQRSLLRQAELLQDHGKYREAISFYNQLIEQEEKAEYYLGRAICYLESNQLSDAKKDIKQSLNRGVGDPMIWYYSGRIAHAEEDFTLAIAQYKNYLRNIPINHESRSEIRYLIKQCGTGKLIKYAPQYAFVENLGTRVNTRFDEFGAIESPTILGKYYFNSNRSGSFGGLRNQDGFKDDIYGNYFVDIYSVESNAGSWSDVKPISIVLNSPKHDILMDFSTNGSYILYYQSRNLSQGKILVDSFHLKETIELKDFISPVVGELGDVYSYLFNDSTLVFSSKRQGGFGGYDLYVTQLRNNKWIDPINLGPEVNSPFDEITPSLSHDGTILFFSSNGYSSLGGYDIFKTNFDYTTKSWKEPKNLGMPINSSEDECYFRLAADGRTASFSSKRKTGMGGYDLYLAYLKEQETSQLTFTPVLPYLFFNYKEKNEFETELLSQIDLIEEKEEETEETLREYFIKALYYGDDDVILHPDNVSRITTVADIMILYPKLNLKITSHSTEEELKSYEMYFSIKRAEEVTEEFIKKGIKQGRLYVKACGANYPIAKSFVEGGSRNVSERYNRRIDLELFGDDIEELKLTYEKPVIAEYLRDRKFAIYSTMMEGLSYRVEVAKINQMFTHQILQDYSDVLIDKDFESNLYRYSVGLYSLYEHAEILKKDLIKNGVFKAKVIPYLNGLKIPAAKLVDLSAEYPDLVNFLQFEH